MKATVPKNILFNVGNVGRVDTGRSLRYCGQLHVNDKTFDLMDWDTKCSERNDIKELADYLDSLTDLTNEDFGDWMPLLDTMLSQEGGGWFEIVFSEEWGFEARPVRKKRKK